ncbi:MAG TPA: DUF5666 domain-containing protein [Thermoanaerobaculia bacterium]|nr:DUF5666 domain-containing protein [Thermoanaerobaculia bacterium]
MKTTKTLAAASFALLLLAACGSSGIGDVLGGGSNNAQTYELRGVVDSVDPGSRSVYLTNVSGYTSMLSNGGGTTARVYFDDQTQVTYQGNTYHPEDLERGDEVTVRVDESGNRLVAESMTVTYDATNSGTTSSSTYPGNSGVYGSTVRGTVSYVDTSRGTIELNRGSGSPLILEYSSNTPVYYNNQTYHASDLERGDEIEVRVQNLNGGRMSAQDITVLRNVSGNNGTYGGNTSSSMQTIRGTVSYVDTSRRTIEIESPTWISGFQSGSNNNNRITISYDTNTSVDVQGRLYPVTNLERGDLVEVHVYSGSTSAYQANRIVLVRDVNAR